MLTYTWECQAWVKHTKELSLLLKKSLFGPKQRERIWSKLLYSKLVHLGSKVCATDICLYIKNAHGKVTAVYVCTGLVGHRDFNRCRWTIFQQYGVGRNKRFGFRENVFRCTYTVRLRGWLSAGSRTGDLLTGTGPWFGFVKRGASLIGKRFNEEKTQSLYFFVASSESELASIRTFHSLVGSLLWTAPCTSPEIGFLGHRATRKTHEPAIWNWKMAKQIARTLNGGIFHRCVAC